MQTRRERIRHFGRQRHLRTTRRPCWRTGGVGSARLLGLLIGFLGFFLVGGVLPAEEAERPSEQHPWSTLQALEDGVVTLPLWRPSLEIPPSLLAQDVLRNILAQSIREPASGGALLAPWQQSIVDQSNPEPITTRSYERLLLRRQRLEAAALKTTPSGWPQVSPAELEEVRTLPGLTCVLQAQRFVADELTLLEPDGWLHMAALYTQTYTQQTFPAPVFWLRDHTAQEALAAMEAHHEVVGDTALFIAQLLALVEVQSHLVAYIDGFEARELLDRVLELEPEHPVALYWAGFLAEKYGDYRPAVRHYGALVEVQVDDQEARLRYSVNRLRVATPRSDEAQAAVAGLERLARDADVTDWIRQVAWHEWVGAVGEEDGPRAVELLRQALRLFPEDPGLHLQLAFYRRRPSWQQALDSLELAADLGPLGTEPGSRVLYDRPRRQGLEQNRAWLEAQLASRQEQFLAALDILQKQWRREPATVRILQYPCGDSIRAMYTLREEAP